MNLKINIQDRALRQRLDAIQKNINKAHKNPKILRSLGLLISAQAKENIEEGTPDGVSSYDILAQSTSNQKRKQGYTLQPLLRTGKLQQSIDFETDGGSLFVSMLEYGKYHQSEDPRKSNLPRRPIFALRQENNEDIASIITNNI